MARRTRFFNLNLPWTVVAIIVFAGLLTGTLAGFICARIPDPPEPKAATIIMILTEEVTRLFQEHRIPVSLDQIPQLMKDAIIAVEDHEFITTGINIRAMFRALWRDIRARRVTEGASTITQQLARNALLTAKTFKRKIKEILIAINLERRLTKDRSSSAISTDLLRPRRPWELKPQPSSISASISGNWSCINLRFCPRSHGGQTFIHHTMSPNGPGAPRLGPQPHGGNGDYHRKDWRNRRKRNLDVVPQTSVKRQAPILLIILSRNSPKNTVLPKKPLYRGFKIYTTLDLDLQIKAEALSNRLPVGKADDNGIINPRPRWWRWTPPTGRSGR